MIRVGLHVPPLPRMRDGKQIVIDSIAAIKGGIDLHGGHVRGLVDWRHPNGHGRVCEAVAIMAHMLTPPSARIRKPDMKPPPREVEKLSPRAAEAMVAKIMTDINIASEAARATGGVFTVGAIRPIIEKALS